MSYFYRSAEGDCLIVLQKLRREAEVVVQRLVSEVVLQLRLEVILVPEVDLHAEPLELLLAVEPVKEVELALPAHGVQVLAVLVLGLLETLDPDSAHRAVSSVIPGLDAIRHVSIAIEDHAILNCVLGLVIRRPPGAGGPTVLL